MPRAYCAHGTEDKETSSTEDKMNTEQIIVTWLCGLLAGVGLSGLMPLADDCRGLAGEVAQSRVALYKLAADLDPANRAGYEALTVATLDTLDTGERLLDAVATVDPNAELSAEDRAALESAPIDAAQASEIISNLNVDSNQ